MIRIAKLSWFSQLGLLLIGAGVLAYAPTAHADEIDPFANVTGHWMSYDRYNDNVKHNRPVGNEAISAPKIETPDFTAPADIAKPPDSISQNETVVQGLKPEDVVAAPTRALDLPILPAINTGFNIPVDSTATENAKAHIITNRAGDTDLHLQEQNWQDAAEIARRVNDAKSAATADEEHPPLEVRMSFLPDPKIAPIYAAKKQTRPHLVQVPSASRPVVAATPIPALTAPKTAECAALDSYKKQQLEAIQTDRQTLQALQSAINDLGLQKQLNFMTGQQTQTLNVSAGNQPTATQTATATP